MSYLPTSQAFLEQSSLLLDAYPDSTRITTKYTFATTSTRKNHSRRAQKQALRQQDKTQPPQEQDHPPTEQTQQTGTQSQQQQPQPPLASLTLKTFTPTAGICLKYRTNKAAEVGRLMTGLGLLAARKDVASLSGPTMSSTVPGPGTAAGDADVQMGEAPARSEEQSPARGAPAKGGDSATGTAGAGKGGKGKKKGGGGGGKGRR